MPSAADLASVALRRCYERLEAGQASVSLQDAAALIRLAREIQRDDAVAAAAEARARSGSRSFADLHQLWDDLEEVAGEAEVGEFEDGCFGVLVDRDDGLGGLHPVRCRVAPEMRGASGGSSGEDQQDR